MRKAYLLIAVACISFVACKRKTTDNTTVTLPVAYVVNGVTDVTVERDSMVTLGLSVNQLPGSRPQESVKITVTGLPSGVTAEVTPENGVPDYDAMITFRASEGAALGESHIKVTATSETGSKSYEVHLNVVAISECASKLIGSYMAVDACDTTTSVEYPVTVNPVFNKTNRVVMSGFFNGSSSSSSVMANLECNGKTLTLPKQNIMFYEVSGSGTYTKEKITVEYVVMSAFDTVICKTVLTREP